MSRKARLHETGDIHHIMSHGIDSLDLFENEQDRQTFMSILNTNFLRFDCHCYGFVFMKNHYHLLIRPSGDTLSKMMRVINNTFARYINKTRNRSGYVFRDRFKSIPTRDLNYVKNLILYIHSNPVSANIVSSIRKLDRYNWSSHIFLTKKENPYSWYKRDYVLSVFTNKNNGSYKSYIKELQAYTNEPSDCFNAWDLDLDHSTPDPVIPSKVFKKEATWVRKKVREAEKKQKTMEMLIRQPNIIQTLLKASCKHFAIKKYDFEQKIRHQTVEICKVIKLFSYWAIEVAGFSGVLVGKLLQRSNTAVLRSATLGESMALEVPFPIKI